MIAEQDAVLLGHQCTTSGRTTGLPQGVEPFASFINGVQKYVVASSQPAGDGAADGGHQRPRSFVADLKQTDGGAIGIHGSIRLAQSLLSTGLVDELRLVIAPTTVGSGQRLFGADELRAVGADHLRGLTVRRAAAALPATLGLSRRLPLERTTPAGRALVAR